MTDEPTEVDRLEPGATGRWLVHTTRSVHVLDLDEMTYQRQPGDTSTPFFIDRMTLTLTRIEVWPSVGGRMEIVFDNLDLPDLFEHPLITSPIRSIRPAGES